MRGDLTSVLLRHFIKYMNYIGAGQMLRRTYLVVSSRIANLQPQKESVSEGQGLQLSAVVLGLPGAGLCVLISVRILTIGWFM